MDYQVEIDSAGRSGNVYYKEAEGTLTFWWEFTMDGAVISVPRPEVWDGFCESSNQGWAKGRRQQIVERIAEQTKRQKASSAKIEYQDDWIVFKF
jgi:hypothetical protein